MPPRGLCHMWGGTLRRWDRDFDSAARFVMSPPIRGAGTAAALKGALAGGLLGAVATDHAVSSFQHHLPRSGASAKLLVPVHSVTQRTMNCSPCTPAPTQSNHGND